MSNRSERASLATETLAILETGSYTNAKGKLISIKEALKSSIVNTILYDLDSFQEIIQKREQKLAQIGSGFKTQITVTNETTLSAAKRLVIEEKYTRPCCLNFASAKNPGGGFLKGSGAQEESLARASGLYPCIAQIENYYQSNRQFRSSLYTDNIIYSPAVPVFRDDRGPLLDDFYRLSFITAPAVNAGAVRKNEPQNVFKIPEIMINRIDKILSIAFIQGTDALILGAWGCGVFDNNPLEVARYFFQFLGRTGRFSGCFQKIIFAVFDRSKNKEIYNAFRKTFA